MPEPSPENRPEAEPQPGPQGSPREGEQGKIHVDAGWKAEAKAEKERLARETMESDRAARAGDAGTGAGTGGMGRLPAPSFAGLVQTLATQAAIFLSSERDPETGRMLQNLDLAKYNIDLLAVIEEKTRGHLTEEEKRLLDRYLYELRMAYVEAAS